MKHSSGLIPFFYLYLVEEGFRNIVDEQDLDKVLVLQMLKKEGAVIYIVDVVATDSVEIEDYNNIKLKSRNVLEKMPEHQNVIYLTIFLAEDKIEELRKAFIADSFFNPDEKIHEITWIADIKKKEILTSKDNITKIFSLYENTQRIISNDDTAEISTKEFRVAKDKALKASRLQIVAEKPYLTFCFMIINTVLWLIMIIFYGDNNTVTMLQNFGANSRELVVYQGEYWRLLTSMFVHVDFTHLLSNMFSLYLFGSRTEKYLGRLKFFTIYLLSGLAGSVLSIVFNDYVSAGASGAIYGLIGTVLAIAIKRKKEVDGLSYYTMILFIVFGFIVGAFSPQIDQFAHIGGLVVGFLVGYIMI